MGERERERKAAEERARVLVALNQAVSTHGAQYTDFVARRMREEEYTDRVA